MTRMKSCASLTTYLDRAPLYPSKIILRSIKMWHPKCSQVSWEFFMRCSRALATSLAWKGSTEWHSDLVKTALRGGLKSRRLPLHVWYVAFLLEKARQPEELVVVTIVWEAAQMTFPPACLTCICRIRIRCRISASERTWVESTFVIAVDRTRLACRLQATSSQSSMATAVEKMHDPQLAAPRNSICRRRFAVKTVPCEWMHLTTLRAPQSVKLIHKVRQSRPLRPSAWETSRGPI